MIVDVLPPQSPDAAELRERQARLPWVVLYSEPEDLPGDPSTGPVHRPDWWEAIVPGDPDAGGVGAWKLSMVQDWLAALGLHRVDREPDDHERIVERWTCDPDPPTYPIPPTRPEPIHPPR